MQEVQSPTVFHLALPNHGQTLTDDQFQALRQRGFSVCVFDDFAPLSDALERRDATNRGWPGLLCLTGTLNGLTALTLRLRMSYPRLGILLLSDWSESALLQALQSGADSLLPISATPELLGCYAYSMFRRQLPVTMVANKRPTDLWRLEQNGWALCSPAGKRFSLTSAERSFFDCLLRHPERQATHAQLLQAIDERGGLAPDNTPASQHSYSMAEVNRLGVLVSRLRRKFERDATDLPIRSIHNWGYMFSAECEIGSQRQQ